MKFGIATTTIIPMRKEPAEQSEMVSQVLFGETFEIIEKKRGWFYVRLKHDNYEGWIDEKMICKIESNFFEKPHKDTPVISSLLLLKAMCIKTKETYYLLPGSSLHNFDKEDNTFENDCKYRIFESPGTCSGKLRENIVEISKLYLNAPYLWGGRTPFGIDCSGFTQIVYKINGINIPRDAGLQINAGKTLNLLHEAKPGDLAFFENDKGEIIHTGIILDNNSIIHASGKVRIDKFDHQGIYNSEIKRYSHKLRVVQSIIE